MGETSFGSAPACDGLRAGAYTPSEPLFKTGEFAALCKTTKNTLIHYDHVGILRPTAVGENGYRYYRPNDLFKFRTIRALTDAGFSLQEVRAIIAEYDPEELSRSIAQRRRALQEHIERLSTAARLLDEMEVQAARDSGVELGLFRIVHRDERLILNLDCTVDSMWLRGAAAAMADGRVLDALARISPEASLSPYGLKAFGGGGDGPVRYDGGFYVLPPEQGADEVAALLSSGDAACGIDRLEVIPAGDYAEIIDVGPPAKAAQTHERLLDELAARGLAPHGPRFEVVPFRLFDMRPGCAYRFVVSVRCE